MPDLGEIGRFSFASSHAISSKTPEGAATIGVSTITAPARSCTRITTDATNARRHRRRDARQLALRRIAATATHRVSCINATPSSNGSNPEDRPEAGVCAGCPGAAGNNLLTGGVPGGRPPEEVAPLRPGANVAVTDEVIEEPDASGCRTKTPIQKTKAQAQAIAVSTAGTFTRAYFVIHAMGRPRSGPQDPTGGWGSTRTIDPQCASRAPLPSSRSGMRRENNKGNEATANKEQARRQPRPGSPLLNAGLATAEDSSTHVTGTEAIAPGYV